MCSLLKVKHSIVSEAWEGIFHNCGCFFPQLWIDFP
jgi:hypothetical protein